MGFNVKLATSGIVGVTRLSVGEVQGNFDASLNSIYALTDAQDFDTSADFTITLPPLSPELIGGTIVEFKNIRSEDPNNLGVTKLVTIDNNGHLIDGTTSNITTNTFNEVFRLVYINDGLGWLVI